MKERKKEKNQREKSTCKNNSIVKAHLGSVKVLGCIKRVLRVYLGCIETVGGDSTAEGSGEAGKDRARWIRQRHTRLLLASIKPQSSLYSASVKAVSRLY